MTYEVILNQNPFRSQELFDLARDLDRVLASLERDVAVEVGEHHLPNACGTPGYSEVRLKLIFDDKDAAMVVKLALGGAQ